MKIVAVESVQVDGGTRPFTGVAIRVRAQPPYLLKGVRNRGRWSAENLERGFFKQPGSRCERVNFGFDWRQSRRRAQRLNGREHAVRGRRR